MEQSCEYGFECFKQIQKSQGEEYKIPYKTNILNIIPVHIRLFKQIYKITRFISSRRIKKENKIYYTIPVVIIIIIIFIRYTITC